MLVLSRYRDESIHIGDDVVITVVDVRGDRVRLGIQAPASVSVHRKEVYDAIVRERDTDDDAAPPEKRQNSTKKTEAVQRPIKKGLPYDLGGTVAADMGGIFHE